MFDVTKELAREFNQRNSSVVADKLGDYVHVKGAGREWIGLASTWARWVLWAVHYT